MNRPKLVPPETRQLVVAYTRLLISQQVMTEAREKLRFFPTLHAPAVTMVIGVNFMLDALQEEFEKQGYDAHDVFNLIKEYV